ncbi:hypothetical protein ABZX92_27710 [Lentzea sp. NPDC006480]|uniref:hypothetical protein n=1 Tax=Lentzea sp. NPDC006480 TaxID=3157176 RepID=UPI0033A77E1A
MKPDKQMLGKDDLVQAHIVQCPPMSSIGGVVDSGAEWHYNRPIAVTEDFIAKLVPSA